MKQIIGVVLILIALSACSQKKKEIDTKIVTDQNEAILKEPKVDKRVELLSIVFRLAGRPEYSQNLFPKYVSNIENHFNAFKNHDLIRYVKDELSEDGVSFSAVMSMSMP